MMKIYKPILVGVFCSIFLAGFTGKEKYVELEGYLNGRYSSEFPEDGAQLQLKNSVAVLKKGTRGQILETRKLSSGNYGIRIKVLNGNETNANLWVYYNVNHPDIALYDVNRKLVVAADKAHAAETTRETEAIRPRPAPKTTVAAVNLIAKTNDAVHAAGVAPCVSCSLAAVAGHATPLRRATRGMAKACSKLVNSQGQLGAEGQSIFSIMAEPKYAPYYTANNALGSFCPKFNQLTKSQRLTAWTWFWTALAQEESSCNPTLVHGTTYKDRQGRIHVLNPREGYGMWAMERDRNIRRSRGSACDNIGNTAGQARCSIDIMLKTELARGRTGITSSSYWGPVRRGSSQLMPHMRRLTLCF